MNFNDYQKEARLTANTDLTLVNALCNWSMGIAGESGELVDYIKKVVYHGKPLDKDNIISELGDILWYIANLAKELDITLEDVAFSNIMKLRNRYPDGFIKGGGVRE